MVTKSKWYRVLSNTFALLMALNIAIVTNDYLFIFQNANDQAHYNSCLLIFNRTTFTPIKKFDFDSNSNSNLTIYATFFSVNQNYYFFGVNGSIVEGLRIDNSLNYVSASKVFESSRVNNSTNYFLVTLYNNIFTTTESGPMNGNQNSTISNIIFHKESLDFETKSWEVLNTVSGAAFATGYSSTNVTTGFLFDNSSTVDHADRLFKLLRIVKNLMEQDKQSVTFSKKTNVYLTIWRCSIILWSCFIHLRDFLFKKSYNYTKIC